MLRSLPKIVAVLVLTLVAGAQDRPNVSLVLPPGIASETVHIVYYLEGPFGGYRSFVKPERERASYDIEPFVEGRAARNIKVIAYLPGCEIATLDLTFSEAPVKRRLDCHPLGSVLFRGQIVPSSLVSGERKVGVSYLALWAHEFFGFADGFIVSFPLGTVRPDQDGKFEILLPDFSKQSSLGDGALEFILGDIKTQKGIALLTPAEATSTSPPWLSVQASYRIVRLECETEGLTDERSKSVCVAESQHTQQTRQ